LRRASPASNRRRARRAATRAALLAGALAALLTATLPAAAQRIVELDRVVAVVNDDVIVLSELERRIATVRAQLRQSGTPPPPRELLEQQVLDRLIVERIQLQRARSAGIRVDDEALNRAVAGIAQQNNLTLRQFRDILERDGFDFSRFREDIRRELLISQLQQRQVTNRIVVSPREVENWLATRAKQGSGENEYRLSHILLALPEAASPEQIAAVRAEAEQVLERLRAGAVFSQTAVAVSDGQQALDGGDLGWRKSTELPTIFADVVPDMEAGDVSDLIRSPSGFHIIKLEQVRGEERFVITQARARHILIVPDELVSDADAEVRLTQLKQRIEGGEAFEELARSHSHDPATAVKGGDLGWVSPGQTVPEFEQEMNQLAPGEVSDPFRTQFGWHIVQVVERRDFDDTEQVRRSKAAEQIRARKREEELQMWMRQLRDEAYVEYRLEEQ